MAYPLTSPPRPNTSPRLTKWLGLPLGLGVLLICLALSVTLGAANISVGTVFDALFRFDAASFDHLVIRTVRLPRVLAGALVGAALAVAGGVMQGLTRNPLADPGILGIEAGASLAVVLAVFALGSPPESLYAPFAALGAALAAAFVYALGSVGRGGATPLKLTLAGAVSADILGSCTAALLITDQDTLEQGKLERTRGAKEAQAAQCRRAEDSIPRTDRSGRARGEGRRTRPNRGYAPACPRINSLVSWLPAA